MSIDYATGGELLERYGRAWEEFDGDAWVSLFADHIEYHEDPFSDPMIGQNAVRAYLLEASKTQEQVEFVVERHWVSGSIVLASWRASFVRRESRARVRIAGFMTLELAADGRIERLREWWHRREHRPDGSDTGQEG